MPIVLREMTREAADAIIAGGRPDDVRLAEDYPTEFSADVVRYVGGEGHIVAHTPLERPQSGRVLEKAGFVAAREVDDADEAGNVVRVVEWERAISAPGRREIRPAANSGPGRPRAG